jgi:RHS repeat-associated protein
VSPEIGIHTDRGFTGHEHLDEMNLIHMNGRIYDPALARFMTADPFLQHPHNLQSYNRYSYVLNNPLAYTDPSGYLSLKGIFTFLTNPARTVAQNVSPQVGQALVAIGSYFCGPFAAACAAVGSYEVARANGASSSQAIRAGVIAGATVWAFNQVGTLTDFHGPTPDDFLSGNHLANIAGHAAIGCASAAASGGECGVGAFSGAAGSFISPYATTMGFEGGLVASIVIGGTVSELAGGKFANGAATAAFGYLFNQAARNRGKGLWGIPCFTCTASTADARSDRYFDSAFGLDDSRPTHANDLLSPRPTHVYQIVERGTDEVLKYGITSNAVPSTRYPPSFYVEYKARMEVIQTYDSRIPARMTEILLNLGYQATHGGRLPPLSVRE